MTFSQMQLRHHDDHDLVQPNPHHDLEKSLVLQVRRNKGNFLRLTCILALDESILHHYAAVVGGVAEWSNAPVLKTDEGESPPRVRIPVPPPHIPIKWLILLYFNIK